MIKQATIPLYIRFGEIPEDGKSKVHLGSEVVGVEPGLSVYETVEANNRYYPVLPDSPNESTIGDYFGFLLESTCKVYLVTGRRIRLNGHDNEPLLEDVSVLKDITDCIRMRRDEV